MADPQKTDGAPVATDDGVIPPSATPPEATPPATGEEKTVTLSEKDYKNLVSQRDKNAEALRSNSAQDAFVMEMAVERTINKFLDGNKEKFPDVELDDLMHVDDPDNLEAEATRIQTKISKTVQAKLGDVQIGDTPVLSEEQKTAELDKLRKNPNTRNRFQKFLGIKLS